MAKPIGSGNSFTYTEWHAAALGVVVGLVAVYVRASGSRGVAVGLVAVFVLAALGFTVRASRSTGQRTIRREPWYALGGLVAGAAVALAAVAFLA